jgi:hypothetical protein
LWRKIGKLLRVSLRGQALPSIIVTGPTVLSRHFQQQRERAGVPSVWCTEEVGKEGEWRQGTPQ